MGKKPDNVVKLSETLTLCEYKSGGLIGFWLYDKTRGMNLSMKAKSETDALVEALTYYQRRLMQVEQEFAAMSKKVDEFVGYFTDDRGSLLD